VLLNGLQGVRQFQDQRKHCWPIKKDKNTLIQAIKVLKFKIVCLGCLITYVIIIIIVVFQICLRISNVTRFRLHLVFGCFSLLTGSSVQLKMN